LPTVTRKSPRSSVSILSAGMQSRLEQHSLGYQEWPRAGETMLAMTRPIVKSPRNHFIDRFRCERAPDLSKRAGADGITLAPSRAPFFQGVLRIS
jgi:hypothetical protein